MIKNFGGNRFTHRESYRIRLACDCRCHRFGRSRRNGSIGRHLGPGRCPGVGGRPGRRRRVRRRVGRRRQHKTGGGRRQRGGRAQRSGAARPGRGRPGGRQHARRVGGGGQLDDRGQRLGRERVDRRIGIEEYLYEDYAHQHERHGYHDCQDVPKCQPHLGVLSTCPADGRSHFSQYIRVLKPVKKSWQDAVWIGRHRQLCQGFKVRAVHPFCPL
ncbi:hypothetical protein FDZ74_01605, partial [bacterium]